MSRHITAADLPEDLARFAEAQVAAGRFSSVEDVIRAGVDALRKRGLADMRREAVEAFAAFDRGEGIEATADQLMDGIDQELSIGQ